MSSEFERTPDVREQAIEFLLAEPIQGVYKGEVCALSCAIKRLPID